MVLYCIYLNIYIITKLCRYKLNAKLKLVCLISLKKELYRDLVNTNHVQG